MDEQAQDNRTSPDDPERPGGDDSESDPYEVPPPDRIRRRNRITGLVLLVMVVIFISITVWARL